MGSACGGPWFTAGRSSSYDDGHEVQDGSPDDTQRGMLLLAIWLIVTGIAGFVAIPIPGVVMGALA